MKKASPDEPQLVPALPGAAKKIDAGEASSQVRSLTDFVDQNRKFVEAAQLDKFANIYKSLQLSQANEVAELFRAQHLATSTLFDSPAFRAAQDANATMRKLYEDTALGAWNKLATDSLLPSLAWSKEAEKASSWLAGFSKYDSLLHNHFADIARYSLQSQLTLSKLPWDAVGNALGIQTTMRDGLRGSFAEFARSYSGLFKGFERQPELVLSLPPELTRLPTVEYFNGVRSVESITIPVATSDEEAPEDDRIGSEIDQETSIEIDKLIYILNPKFLVMLRGARQALNTRNPDRARHLAVSLRELYTQVLHAIASDENVKNWSSAPEHYSNGRPTRRARMQYLGRTINSSEFSTFLEKDLIVTEEFLKLFQRGTHEVAANYTDTQLQIMLIRMEGLLRFLLVLANPG